MEKHILSVFSVGCQDSLRSASFEEKRAAIKSLFFNRDFDGIFKNPSLLETYTADYAPSRALCYHHLFSREPQLVSILSGIDDLQILCIGGGAGSEMVGIGAALAPVLKDRKTTSILILQDIADYTSVLHRLENAFRKFYSVPVELLSFQHAVYDVTQDTDQRLGACLSACNLITACFILNEILSASRSKFVQLITKMVHRMSEGAFLLVVDSAGSFSELEVGQQTVMCYHLLDRIAAFDCLVSKDAAWYRLPPGLQYPSKLNNMRYFLRLYRKR
jgi:25S rRNA (uracil2843-N3)-methyltransferase